MGKRRLALAVFVLSMSNCYVATYDPYYYDYAYYDPYYYGYDGYWGYTWIDPYGVYYYSQAGAGTAQALDVNAAASAIAARASSYFHPSDCVSATATGATVSYRFSNCAGDFGIQSMSGTATLTVSNPDGQIVLHGTSSDLTINGRPYVLDLTTTAKLDGSERIATFSSSSRSPDLFQSRHAEGTITWQQGSFCIDDDGSGSSARGKLNSTAKLSLYRRCGTSCPSSGKVTVDGPSGTFTGTFNGTPSFVVTAPNGDEKTYTLQCSG